MIKKNAMQKILVLFSLLFVLKGNAQNEVLWVVSGAQTPTSIALRAKLSNNSNQVRALLSTNNPPSAPFIYSTTSIADLATNNRIVKLEASGLQPNTRYYYIIEADGQPDNSTDDIGSFMTPNTGPTSFTFMAGSCNREPNTKTYNDFLAYNPLFYLNSGDLHYADPNSNDVNIHRAAYEDRIFTRPLQVNLFRQLPLVYVWDDHDYCGNADDGPRATGATSAAKAYREYIPHFPFPPRTGADSGAIYQSFEIGRVKFILSDLRSQRKRNDTTAMGLVQKEWFKKQLVDARNRNLMTCWVGSYSWYGTVDDNWVLNPTERKEICEFMRDSLIENLFMINGDAHMFAIDNGSNGDFTTAKNLPYKYPVLQAGPIENSGSFKGGTYSEGTYYVFFQKAAQYGVVNVQDNGGDSICVTLTGYKKDLTTEATTQLVQYSFCRKLGAYIAGVPALNYEETQIDVYPNPSTGEFFFRSHENKEAKVSIYSSDGRFLFASNLAPNTVLPIKLNGFSAGVYQAEIKIGNSVFTKKLIVCP